MSGVGSCPSRSILNQFKSEANARVFVLRVLRLLALISVSLMAQQSVANSFLFPATACLNAPYTGAQTPGQRGLANLMRDLRRLLVDFPSLLDTLEAQSPQLCYSDTLLTEKAYFDVGENRIVLSTDLSHGLALVVLVHEVRHVDQLARGICPTQDLAMHEYAHGVLAMEADANVISLLVAWKSKAEGDASLWHALEDWQMTADIAARFDAVMRENHDFVAAATAAFEQWYASDRRRELYYIASCSAYLDHQDRTHALPRYLSLSDDYFSRLCILPDGQPYACLNVIAAD